MPQIDVKGLTVTYIDKKKNETVAVDNLDAVFPSGKFCVVTGVSGCGKSTLLKAIGGLFEFDGHIYIDGLDADNIPTKKRNFAYVSQNFDLYPSLTVFDNIAFPLNVMRKRKEEVVAAVTDIADKLNLTDCLTRLPQHLSGGQQQRVSLARALVKRPDVCLFDEPLSNIDSSLRREIRGYIRSVTSAMGYTCIYVTHDMADITALADIVYVIAGKKVVFCGNVTEFLACGDSAVTAVRQSAKGGFGNEN